MELPDEAIRYDFQGFLVPVGEEWTAAAELRARHFIYPARLKDLTQRLLQCRSQVAADREACAAGAPLRNAPADAPPLFPGFIDLPQQQLDQHRRKGDESEAGKAMALAARLREDADRVVFLGAGGPLFAARALFEALRSAHHNELPPETRLGVPRIYFAGDHADTDALQDLLELLQITCVDPEDRREERWAVVALSKSGKALEPGVALRVFRREASEYYGLRSEWHTRLFAAITGNNSKLRDLFAAHGHPDEEVLAVPDNVASRFATFTPAGLLPAAVMGLDVRALLLGAAAMTKRFLEEPFERNPVLQYAAVNYLMAEELGKPVRVFQVWSKKLEAVGRWYEVLVSESLGKAGRGPTTLACVATRDLYARGQTFQEGPRDRAINNLVVKQPRAAAPIQVQMADHNEDELNVLSRKTLADVLSASHQACARAWFEVARPSADLVVPALTEHTLGQLLQMLMLATVVEGRLMGVNPYGQPGVEVYRRHRDAALRAVAPPSD